MSKTESFNGGKHKKKLKELKIVVFGIVHSGTAVFLKKPCRKVNYVKEPLW